MPRSPISLKFTGEKKMAQKIFALEKKFPGKARAALLFRGERVMTRSKNEFVPADKSILKNSGRVVLERTGITVTLSYGGDAKAYALAVHEHLSPHSPPSWRNTTVRFSPSGRGPKYLQKPLLEQQRTLAKDLASDLRVEKWAAI